jgi:hypothetical protein
MIKKFKGYKLYNPNKKTVVVKMKVKIDGEGE